MKICTVILLLCVHVVNAQVKVNEIRMKFGSEYHKAKDPDVTYPVLSVGAKEIDDKINFKIIKELTANDSTDVSKALFLAMNDGLSELDYDITLNTKDILSLRLNAMGCGAYCSSYFLYFNFNLHTGEELKLNDVISGDKTDSFKAGVLKDKIKALTLDKKQKDSLLAIHEIDSSDYQFALDHIKENCTENVSMDKFLLFKNEIEIIDRCEFAHAMKPLEPVYQLKYGYGKIKKFIVPAFLDKVK